MKDPRYGDVFEWRGATSGSQVVVMFLAPANQKGYWIGIRLNDWAVDVSRDWVPLTNGRHGRWRAVS